MLTVGRSYALVVGPAERSYAIGLPVRDSNTEHQYYSPIICCAYMGRVYIIQVVLTSSAECHLICVCKRFSNNSIKPLTKHDKIKNQITVILIEKICFHI